MTQEYVLPPSKSGGYENDEDFRVVVRNIIEGLHSGAVGIQPGDTIYLDPKDMLAVQARLHELGKTGVNILSQEEYQKRFTKPEEPGL